MTRRSGGGREGSRGLRGLKVRVRTAKKRSVSSARWLERQLNDPYVAKAKREGFRSRAAYKLAELDARFRLLKPGMAVVDLGAAPGGWTQVAVRRVRAEGGEGAAPGGKAAGGKVVALDILPMDPVPGAETLTLDFLDDAAPGLIRKALGGGADVVLSDMAPPASGERETDHLRIMALAEAAAEFAAEVLKPGGAFVAKVWQGGTEAGLLARLKRLFAAVRHAKPPASRPESAEVYVVATGFRGGA